MKFSEFNFGEYDGRQECLRDERYFLDSFELPPNFVQNNVKNNRDFIVLGGKGVGKSSLQMYIELMKSSEGYLTDFISFYDDLTQYDYLEFSKTQRISFVEIADVKNIATLYDFQEIWTRIILKRIADKVHENGKISKFTNLMRKTHSGSKSIVDNIISGLKIKADFNTIFGNINLDYDLSSIVEGNEMRLSDFNVIAKKQICLDLKDARLFISIDELVVSNFETKSDEYKVRIALIRDIIRV